MSEAHKIRKWTSYHEEKGVCLKFIIKYKIRILNIHQVSLSVQQIQSDLDKQSFTSYQEEKGYVKACHQPQNKNFD
jgi:hypothetical protein